MNEEQRRTDESFYFNQKEEPNTISLYRLFSSKYVKYEVYDFVLKTENERRLLIEMRRLDEDVDNVHQVFLDYQESVNTKISLNIVVAGAGNNSDVSRILLLKDEMDAAAVTEEIHLKGGVMIRRLSKHNEKATKEDDRRTSGLTMRILGTLLLFLEHIGMCDPKKSVYIYPGEIVTNSKPKVDKFGIQKGLDSLVEYYRLSTFEHFKGLEIMFTTVGQLSKRGVPMTFSPECWKTKESRSKRGKFYSINLEKGESQWGMPLTNDDEVGWEKNISKTNNQIYYRNIKTRYCQWIKPKPKKEPLKENWEERRSTNCNQIYYINSKENISQWKHPNESITQTKSIEKKQLELNEIKARLLKEQEEKRQIDLLELNKRKAREEEKKKKSDKDDELWPMRKMHEMLIFKGSIRNRQPKTAVVLTTGAMNPVHKGHIALINQAKLRLWYAGYEVVGVWLSPSQDSYLQPKALRLNTIGLSAPFRVEVTKRTVAIDPLFDVGLWESSQPSYTKNDFVDFPEVCLSLKKHIEKEFGAEYGEITVFYACGTDHANNMNLYNGPHEWGGVVVVPREGDITGGTENEENKVYIAPSSSPDIAGFSSTKIRKAIAENKPAIVKQMMTGDAAKFLLTPTEEERIRFAKDFKKLETLPKAG